MTLVTFAAFGLATFRGSYFQVVVTFGEQKTFYTACKFVVCELFFPK